MKTENIKQIRNNFRLKPYDYNLLHRSNKIALYEMIKKHEYPDKVYTVKLYEVHIIRIREATLPNGVKLPKREILASASEFGTYGFAPWTLERAIKKFNYLNQREYEKGLDILDPLNLDEMNPNSILSKQESQKLMLCQKV